MNSESNAPKLQDIKTIRYQYLLDRVQKIKNIIVAAVLSMLAYSANAVASANNYKTILILWIACAILLFALYYAGRDAGAALHYNEESQEGLDRNGRLKMYRLIISASVLTFLAQSLNSCSTLSATKQKFSNQSTHSIAASGGSE